MGVNRSVTIVLLYLISAEFGPGMTLDEAWTLVKAKRICARPHPLYWKQLREIDAESFSLLRLPKGSIWQILVRCSEPTLRAFRCTFRNATRLVHEAFCSTCDVASVKLIQKNWRSVVARHFASHWGFRFERKQRLIAELVATSKVRLGNSKEALALRETFVMLCEEEERKRSFLARKPLISSGFVRGFLDQSYHVARIEIFEEIIPLFEAICNLDHPEPSLTHTRVVPVLLELAMRVERVMWGRMEFLRNNPHISQLQNRLHKSKHVLDMKFCEAVKGNPLVYGVSTGELARFQLMSEDWINHSGQHHLDQFRGVEKLSQLLGEINLRMQNNREEHPSGEILFD
jgi:hypothetical protein